jgi:hypothetical protein
MKEKIRFKKIAKMTVADHNSAVQLRSSQFSVTVIIAVTVISFTPVNVERAKVKNNFFDAL